MCVGLCVYVYFFTASLIVWKHERRNLTNMGKLVSLYRFGRVGNVHPDICRAVEGVVMESTGY